MNQISIIYRAFFVISTVLLLSVAKVNGQPVPQGYSTLEWKCHQSASILRGSIESVEPVAGGVGSDNYNEYSITIAITESYKGDVEVEATFHIGLSNPDADYARSRIGTGDEFLIFLESDGGRFRLHGNDILVSGLLPFLSDKELAADPYRGRCHVWHDFSGQMLTARQLANLIPEVVAANRRFEITGSTEICASHFEILIAPADDRLFQFCRELLDGTRTASAMNAFQSSGSEDLPYLDALKILTEHEPGRLVDTLTNLLESNDGAVTYVMELDDELYAERTFPLRQRAFQQLQELGFDVEPPVDMEIIWRRPKVQAEFEAIARIREAGGSVVYDYGPEAPQEKFLRVTNISLRHSPVIPDLSSFKAVHTVTMQLSTIDDLAPLLAVKDTLKHLDASHSEIQDGDLEIVARLSELESLMLIATDIGDLSPLSDLGKLKKIVLFDTSVTDLSPLENITSLESVMLDGQAIEWQRRTSDDDNG